MADPLPRPTRICKEHVRYDRNGNVTESDRDAVSWREVTIIDYSAPEDGMVYQDGPASDQA